MSSLRLAACGVAGCRGALGANPLDDIANTQTIEAVCTRGEALDRPARRAAWK